MEKTSKFTRVFDKKKGKFVFKPSDETPETNQCCTYGNYVKCE